MATQAEQLTLPFEDAGAAGTAETQWSTAAGTYPSDEQILGISDASPSTATRQDGGADGPGVGAALAPPSAQRTEGTASSTADDGAGKAPSSTADIPGWLQPLLSDPKAGREAQALWAQHQAYKEIFPDGVEAARQALQRGEQLGRIDAAYYNGDSRGQAQLAQYLLEDNPAAFQRMLAHATRALAQRDPAAYQQFARAVASGGKNSAVILSEAKDPSAQASEGFFAASAPRVVGRDSAQNDGEREVARERAAVTRERAEIARERGEFHAEQYARFQQSANEGVVAQVRSAIEQSLAGVLPSSVPDAARRRIAENIFSDINATLQHDRGLSRQVREILQQWRFDDTARQQVVNLIFGRARAMVPATAKRIVSEWTAGVVSAQRQKNERQQAAAQRVDLAGGGAMDALPARPLKPQEIDYSKTTDDQILSL